MKHLSNPNNENYWKNEYLYTLQAVLALRIMHLPEVKEELDRLALNAELGQELRTAE